MFRSHSRTIYYLIKKENYNMDKNQNLTSFQELTTTELNQITGGGWWLDSILDMLTSKIPDQANRYGNHQQM